MSTPALEAEYALSHRPLRAAATELMLTMLLPRLPEPEHGQKLRELIPDFFADGEP